MADSGLMLRHFIVQRSETRLADSGCVRPGRYNHSRLGPELPCTRPMPLRPQARSGVFANHLRFSEATYAHPAIARASRAIGGNLSHRGVRYFTAARGTVWLDCLHPKPDGGQQMGTHKFAAVRNLLCAFSVAASILLIWLLEVSRIQG